MSAEKTNVMRILDKAKVPYTPHYYSHDDGLIDAVSVAAKLGQPVERVYKTLVTRGASKSFFVFVLPAAMELNLKAAAKAVGEKSIEMIHYLPNMNYVIPAVLSHHERYDGKGYPRGLKGEDIPLLGRILAVCDSFDAMTTKRTYKEAMSIDYAISELEHNKGTQFDPKLAEAFIELLKEGKIEV